MRQLPIMETFYSIQGEGHHTGVPSFFIRLGGCDVGCPWCDVKESWDVNAHPKRSIDDLVNEVVDSGAKVAIITGGEPLMHNLDDLCRELQSNGIKTHLETSGAHPLSGNWDWICLSPKKFKNALDAFYDIAHELKVIVFNKHDLQWSEGHKEKCQSSTKFYLQPEWDKREMTTPMVLNYIRENPEWSISMQTHKYIGVP